MSLDDWKKDETGNIIVQPLLSYETMIAAGMAIGIRLEHAHPGEKILKSPDILQLVLTPHQATLLAQDLLIAAEMIGAQKPDGPVS